MEDKEIDKECEAALLRVKALREMKSLILLSHIKEIKNQMIELKSKAKYGIKEADAVQDDKEVAANRTDMIAQISELSNTQVNHKIVRETFQNAALNVQMQSAVHETLQDLDVESGVNNSLKIQMILAHYSNNIHTSKALSDCIEEKEALDKDIVQLKMDSMALIHSIKRTWQAFDGNINISLPNEDADIARYKESILTRESKLGILIHMLQGLISTCGIMWGAEDHYIQVMLLCDLIINEGSKSELDDILKSLEESREQREKKRKLQKQNASKEAMKSQYFTSTPLK